MTHTLKTWRPYFDAILTGAKTFEARQDDRGFSVGDTLRLREWDADEHRFTGREVSTRVTYILRGPAFGVEAGHVVMAIAPSNSPQTRGVSATGSATTGHGSSDGR